jgi:hypothetical protein
MSKDLVINFDKLEKEFQKAVTAEEKYSRENAAKFRAIEQRAGTYEDFRQIVLASHLRPLDKGETLQSIPIKNSWNLAADKNNLNDNNSKKLNIDDSNLTQAIPKSNLEFIQLWRKIGTNQQRQWEFLENIGANKLVELFMSEINGDMLGKFINVFSNQIKKNQLKRDFDLIVNLLNGFPKCNRFELNFLFLQKNEVESCKNLFEKILNFYRDHENDTNIDLFVLKAYYFK